MVVEFDIKPNMTDFFGKRRKNSSLCAHCVAAKNMTD